MKPTEDPAEGCLPVRRKPGGGSRYDVRLDDLDSTQNIIEQFEEWDHPLQSEPDHTSGEVAAEAPPEMTAGSYAQHEQAMLNDAMGNVYPAFCDAFKMVVPSKEFKKAVLADLKACFVGEGPRFCRDILVALVTSETRSTFSEACGKLWADERQRMPVELREALEVADTRAASSKGPPEDREGHAARALELARELAEMSPMVPPRLMVLTDIPATCMARGTAWPGSSSKWTQGREGRQEATRRHRRAGFAEGGRRMDRVEGTPS